MERRRRAVAWVKDDPFGVEFAEIELRPSRLRATGVAIGGGPLPYRLDYELETGEEYVTSRLHVGIRGEGWERTLELQRNADSAWSIEVEHRGKAELDDPGGDPATLTEARDCDLALSPVTNLMPILRHDLLTGDDPVELTAAWVSVPDLAIHADGQRYVPLGHSGDGYAVRFEALDDSFAADIALDLDGIALDYPGIARRLGSTT